MLVRWFQAKRARVCAQVESDRSSMNNLLDEVDEVELVLKKARRKGQAGLAAVEERLKAAREEVAAFRRSKEHRQHGLDLRQLLSHFPELILKYPKTEPFRGTAAEVGGAVCSAAQEDVY